MTLSYQQTPAHEAEDAFRTMEILAVPNFITPNQDSFHAFGQNPRYYIELSSGRGMNEDFLVGVTVLMRDSEGTLSRRFDLSRCFRGPSYRAARKEAKRYLLALRWGDLT